MNNIQPPKFSVSDIEDYQERCYDIDEATGTRNIGQYNDVTQHLVMWMCTVGVSTITSENWKDFYARVFMFELCSGRRGVPNPSVFKDFIGLKVLNRTPVSKSKFEADVIRALRAQAQSFIKDLEAPESVDDTPRIVV